MSFPVIFYTFSKKPNSTLVPSSAGTTYNVVLKEPCSVINPVIELNGGNKSPWNYCYIATWNRYYFIDDWTADHGLWIAHCSVDVLASFRTDILNSSQFVLRSASSADSHLIDGMYPVTSKVDLRTLTLLNSSSQRPLGLTLRYVVAISNGASASQVGGCTYYNLNYGEFASVMRLMLGSTSYLGDFSLDSISDALVKALVNPLTYIGECYVLPYNIGSGTQALLSAGWWPIDTTAGYNVLNNNDILSKHEIWRKNSVPIPVHPQSATIGAYLNCAPFTQYVLYAGPFGVITLDATMLSNCARVDFVVNGDFKGNIELEIWGWQTISGTLTAVLVDKRMCNAAIPISISQIKNDISAGLELAGNALAGAASAATGNPVGLIANVDNGLKSAEGYFVPKAEGRAGVGSFDDILEDWTLVGEFRNVTERAPNIYGSPLCQDKILSTLTGYTKCGNPYISISGTKAEAEMIINYLDSGFYIDT